MNWSTRIVNNLDNNKMLKSRNSHSSSKNLMMKLRNSRKISRMSSMKEIFLVLSLSEEMMSWLFFTKRSRSFKVLSPEVKFNTKRDLKISDCLSSRLVITRVSSESLSRRLLKFLIWEKKFTIFKDSFWLKDFKLKHYLKSLKIPLTAIDGES